MRFHFTLKTRSDIRNQKWCTWLDSLDRNPKNHLGSHLTWLQITFKFTETTVSRTVSTTFSLTVVEDLNVINS